MNLGRGINQSQLDNTRAEEILRVDLTSICHHNAKEYKPYVFDPKYSFVNICGGVGYWKYVFSFFKPFEYLLYRNKYYKY